LPGSRFDRRGDWFSPNVWSRMTSIQATPIAAVSKTISLPPFTVDDLAMRGILSAGIVITPNFISGAMTTNLPFAGNVRETRDFSLRDDAVIIFTLWEKREKSTRGSISARVYDLKKNSLVVNTSPRRITLPETLATRQSFSFSPATLPSG